MIANLKFSDPARSDVAILHADDYWIRKLVLKEMPATTLGLYPQDYTIYVTAGLIARTLARLRFVDWVGLVKGSAAKGLFRQLYEQYILACLDRMGAKVVLTFIDNSSFFQRLSRQDRQRTYFAIQNGARTLACVRDSLPAPPHPAAVISMTNFFCFGERDIALFGRHGHRIDNCHPVGSLVGGYYKSMVSTGAEKHEFDLCLVSQWHEHFFEENRGDGFPQQAARRTRAGMEGLNAFLRRLLDETSLTLLICPRKDDAAEHRYYEAIFGGGAAFVRPDRRDFSTYRAIERCRLTIALNSTTLSEVFAWGRKVLWCNVPDDEHFEMPEAGISYFHGGDYQAFRQRVLELLEMPQERYQELSAKSARHINRFDPLNPPHEIIRSTIIGALPTSD
ncbi:MAG: hypothetical protein AB1642_08595 [Pseudomonadota bacterium]